MNPETLIILLAVALNRINPDPTSTVEIILDPDVDLPEGRGLTMEKKGMSVRLRLMPVAEAKAELDREDGPISTRTTLVPVDPESWMRKPSDRLN